MWSAFPPQNPLLWLLSYSIDSATVRTEHWIGKSDLKIIFDAKKAIAILEVNNNLQKLQDRCETAVGKFAMIIKPSQKTSVSQYLEYPEIPPKRDTKEYILVLKVKYK